MERIHIPELASGMQSLERFSGFLKKTFIRIFPFPRKDLRQLKAKDIYRVALKMGNWSKGQENSVRVDMVAKMVKMGPSFSQRERKVSCSKGRERNALE